MSGIAVGGLIFLGLMLLLVLRVPIGISMFMAGAGGYVFLNGGETVGLLNTLKSSAYARLSNYDLAVLPLFMLMGQFATHGGLSRSLFRFVSAFLGHRRGGIAMASVGACAGFGAICGSSLATAATMGQVALLALVGVAVQGGFHLPDASAGWWGLAGLTLLYGTGFTIMFTVLPRLGVVGNSAIMNVEPIFALVLAWAVLGQSIAPSQVAGGLVVVATVMWLGLRRR